MVATPGYNHPRRLNRLFWKDSWTKCAMGGIGRVLPRGYPVPFLSTKCDGSHWWGHKGFTIFGIWTRGKGPICRVPPSLSSTAAPHALRGMPRGQWTVIGANLRYTLIPYQSMCDSKQAVGTFGYLGFADWSWLTRLGSTHPLPRAPSASPLSFPV